jgi:signal peptidase I
VINSPPDSDQLPIVSMPAPSSAELERLRQHSIRVLGSVAAALEAAAEQRQKLLAEVHAAEQTLQELADERETAGASLAATRALLDEAAIQLELAQVQRGGILCEVEELHSAGVATRVALHDEVAALEVRRDELARLVAQARIVLSAAVLVDAGMATPSVGDVLPHADAAARMDVPVADMSAEIRLQPTTPLPRWSEEIRAVRARINGFGLARRRAATSRPSSQDVSDAARPRIKRLVRARPIHLGLSQLATGALIALLLGLALLLTPLTQVFGGLQLLAVMSGSMEPTIPVGGIVAIRPVSASDLKVGDAITFVNLSNPDVLVTHRIVSIELRDGQTMLTTKGDANDSVDALSAPASRAVGRVDFALPYLGYLMVWLGTPVAKIGIVALAVLGLVLTSVQRSNGPSTPTPSPAAADTYLEHEREIHSLLGH